MHILYTNQCNDKLPLIIPFFSSSSIGGLFEISLRNLSLIFVLFSSLSFTEMISRATFCIKIHVVIVHKLLIFITVSGRFHTHCHAVLFIDESKQVNTSDKPLAFSPTKFLSCIFMWYCLLYKVHGTRCQFCCQSFRSSPQHHSNKSYKAVHSCGTVYCIDGKVVINLTIVDATRLGVVPLSLSPLCIMRKKTARKKWLCMGAWSAAIFLSRFSFASRMMTQVKEKLLLV